ncbi:unnamed protein product [Dovyalis caffra]|uniref:Uncharacterized protein n=1 Tax=Dovyalis caffra TaxID=77055 RepID=A0AAV1R4U5_9ROSI|nr:unnamed protein product [Dovyalis caffra]
MLDPSWTRARKFPCSAASAAPSASRPYNLKLAKDSSIKHPRKMLLRSASTSAAGPFFSPFSASPDRDFDTVNNSHTKSNHIKHYPLFHDHRLSLPHGLPHLNLTPLSGSSSSPLSELNQEKASFRLNSFRRAWSDSNLDDLVYTWSCDQDEFHNSTTTPNKFPYRHHKRMLHSSPSFSIFNKNDGQEDEELNRVDMGREEDLMRTITIGENIESIGSGDFSFGKKSMGLIQEEGEEDQEQGSNEIENTDIEEVREPVSPPMYLATGLGIDDIDFGGDSGGRGGFNLSFPNFDESGPSGDVEEYYKKMIYEYPCHPLLLSNYARLLQSKGDLRGADEYYHLATLADPVDGEILMQYAKLQWELNHDKDRALINFERAVQAAPQNSSMSSIVVEIKLKRTLDINLMISSAKALPAAVMQDKYRAWTLKMIATEFHVLAAYASFLWEIAGDGEWDTSQPEYIQVGMERREFQLSLTDMEDYAASDANKGGNTEEYYRRIVEENPCNSLVLRNYAEFLYQKHKYKSLMMIRMILQTYSVFRIASRAKLKKATTWRRDHSANSRLGASKRDLEGAEEYYSRAILADPGDGEILSQYAKLVWESYGNHDKALCYFEQAVQATPKDSHVLAAYASFLWETEENDEDSTSQFQMPNHHGGAIAAANA